MAWRIEPIAVEAGAPSPTPARGPFFLAHPGTLPLIDKAHSERVPPPTLDLTPLHPDTGGWRSVGPFLSEPSCAANYAMKCGQSKSKSRIPGLLFRLEAFTRAV
jgi:hypothetical protein